MLPLKMLSSIAIVLTILISVDAQSIGTCTAADIAAAVARLPNSDVCNYAIQNVTRAAELNLDRTEIMPHLTMMCTPDCGGRFARFLTSCGDEGRAAAYLATVHCIPNSGGTSNYCRTEFPDIINQTIFDDLQSCMSFTAGSACPSGCTQPLARAVQQLGCCYRSLYFERGPSTRLSSSFELLSQARMNIVDGLRSAELFTACNITLPNACEGNSFTAPTNVGLCTPEEVGLLFVGDISIDCANANLAVFGLSTLIPTTVDNAFDQFCQTDCAPAIANKYLRNCSDPFVGNTTTLPCFQTRADRAVGNRCDIAAPMFTEAVTALGASLRQACTDLSNCSEMCRNALMQVNPTLGCCFQHFLNDSFLLDGFFISGNTNLPSREESELLRDPRMWEMCNVDLIPACEDPFSAESAGIKYMIPFITIATTALVAVFVN